MYSVGEGDGQAEVCTVLTGQTARNITVTITVQSDAASGRVFIIRILFLSESFNEFMSFHAR